MQATPAGRSSPFLALKNPTYRTYWLSGLGMMGAQQSQRLVMAWLILDLTDSVGQLGLMVFVMGVPMSLMSLWGGVLADRLDRRLILMATQGFTSLNLLILAALTFAGLVETWQVYLSSFGLGITQAMTNPARNSMIRSLVEDHEIRNAVSLNAVQMQSSQVIWPSIAGLIISIASIGAGLVMSAALSLWGMLLLTQVHPRPMEPRKSKSSPLRDLVDGVKYTFSSPRVGPLMIAAIMLGFLALPYMSLAPGFAREVLGFSAGETGLLLMASGVGAILGSVISLIVPFRDNLRTYILASAMMGASVGTVALVPVPIMAFIPAGGFGFCMSFLVVSGQTLFQTEVPEDLLGRVTSIWGLVAAIGFLASLPVGILGDILGIRLVLIAIGYTLFFLVFAYTFTFTNVFRPVRIAAAPEAAPQLDRTPSDT